MTTDVSADLGLRWNVGNDEPPDPNEGFITDIDIAMKEKLHGIYVNDEKSDSNRRLMRVYFRWPQVEVTDQTFPFATIDLVRFARAADREQRSSDPYLPYAPKGYALPADNSGDFIHTGEMPIPYDFTYSITVHTRFNMHLREIEYQLVQDDRLPSRGAYLVVNDTIRQMFVDGPTPAHGEDPQSGGRPKRHFRDVWTVVTHGELFQKDIKTLAQATSMVTRVSAGVTTTE